MLAVRDAACRAGFVDLRPCRPNQTSNPQQAVCGRGGLGCDETSVGIDPAIILEIAGADKQQPGRNNSDQRMGVKRKLIERLRAAITETRIAIEGRISAAGQKRRKSPAPDAISLSPNVLARLEDVLPDRVSSAEAFDLVQTKRQGIFEARIVAQSLRKHCRK